MKSITQFVLTTLALISLSACGGGGGGGSAAPSGGGSTSDNSTLSLYCAYITSPTYLNQSVSSSPSTYSPILGGILSSGLEVCSTIQRTITGNGIPNHAIGTFPNPNDPNAITVQNISFITTVTPVKSTNVTYLTLTAPGYLNNGVKLDPGTAETVDNSGNVCNRTQCPWNVEAIGPSSINNFGVDSCNGHTQPNGAYHYHSIPACYIQTLTQKAASSVTLIGWAIDGFPIYGNYGYADANNSNSAIRQMNSSWQLKAVPDAGRPSTTTYPMGTFTQDYQYIAGSGDLDECNGRTAVTPDFPQGIYQYYTTSTFPYIQRCIHGTK